MKTLFGIDFSIGIMSRTISTGFDWTNTAWFNFSRAGDPDYKGTGAGWSFELLKFYLRYTTVL